MSAATAISLLPEAQDKRYLVERQTHCRFCDCNQDHPCSIALREADDGNFHLAHLSEHTTLLVRCKWFVPGICNSPWCIEKLLLEMRSAAARARFDALEDRTG
jgi:hypothetical protein